MPALVAGIRQLLFAETDRDQPLPRDLERRCQRVADRFCAALLSAGLLSLLSIRALA